MWLKKTSTIQRMELYNVTMHDALNETYSNDTTFSVQARKSLMEMRTTNPSLLPGFQASLGTVWCTSLLLNGSSLCGASQRQARTYQSILRSRTIFLPRSVLTKPLPWGSASRPSPRTLRASATEPLVLTEENVNLALDEVKQKLGSMFGNSKENRNVGITGDVYLASLDGPIVVLGLSGRFWHKREDVVSRKWPICNYCANAVDCTSRSCVLHVMFWRSLSYVDMRGSKAFESLSLFNAAHPGDMRNWSRTSWPTRRYWQAVSNAQHVKKKGSVC